jgi:Ni,Fe-hydrogenase III large subunit
VTTHRDALADAIENGWLFAGLYAIAAGGPVRLVLANDDGGIRIETADCVAGAVPSIVDLAPAANWDEREAHDLYGVRFDGHEPMRPLVEHDLDVARWTVPIQGRDPYQVAVGPIHAGVIESGHFRFHLVGEKILHLDARLFYKHRGLERAAEGSSLADGIRYVARACAACAVTNGVAYALAVEEATGLRPSTELARVRTVLLELERVWSHLNDISAVCAGTGLAAGAQRFAGLTERARQLNERLTGHRFLLGTVRVGGSDLVLDADAISVAREELGALRVAAASGWRELVFNRSFDDRLLDVGVVRAKEARRLGATGPAARASGMAVDVRAVSPRLAYDGFAPVVPSRTVGDVKSRLEQRHLELVQSFDLLEALLADPIGACSAERGAPERDIAAARVESPRGATLCVVERDGDRLARVHLRTGSYANWPVVAFAAAGNMLPDFPLINKSFELCYACADR